MIPSRGKKGERKLKSILTASEFTSNITGAICNVKIILKACNIARSACHPLHWNLLGRLQNAHFQVGSCSLAGKRQNCPKSQHGQSELWDARLFYDSKTDTCLPTLPVTRDTVTLDLRLSHTRFIHKNVTSNPKHERLLFEIDI